MWTYLCVDKVSFSIMNLGFLLELKEETKTWTIITSACDWTAAGSYCNTSVKEQILSSVLIWWLLAWRWTIKAACLRNAGMGAALSNTCSWWEVQLAVVKSADIFSRSEAQMFILTPTLLELLLNWKCTRAAGRPEPYRTRASAAQGAIATVTMWKNTESVPGGHKPKWKDVLMRWGAAWSLQTNFLVE